MIPGAVAALAVTPRGAGRRYAALVHDGGCDVIALEQAADAGAFGSPFYVVRESGERFWGQDRLDFLDRHLATL